MSCYVKDAFKLIPSLHPPNASFNQRTAQPCYRSQRLNSIDYQCLLAVDLAELEDLGADRRNRSGSLDRQHLAFTKPSIEKAGQCDYLTAQAHRPDRDR